MDLYIFGGLKLASVVCTCLAGLELQNTGKPHWKNPALYSLLDVAYLVTCVGTCIVLVTLIWQLVHVGSLWAMWTPILCFDLFVTCAFCIETAFMVLVVVKRRLRCQGAPGIVCLVHGLIVTSLVGDLLDCSAAERTEQDVRRTEIRKVALNRMIGCQHVCSPYRFIWLVIRHGWQEHVWSGAVAIMYYVSILLRIPLFRGLLAGGDSAMPFNKAMLLLVASCAAEGLVCSFAVSLSVRSQIRAQLLLETAIFKKVTCLSAAGVAANPPGFVSSLLAADAWVVALFLSFLANACIGILCIPVVLAALAQEVGYEPACACLAWILAVFAVSCTIIEPLLYKSCRILYKFRDQRLKKFTDFLLSIRPIKMSALEGVFQKSLLQLRENEINQAFRVNIFEMLLETLFGASSTMVREMRYA
ncbi:hypothetical protein HPB50_028178 [Hyalomma asiaticum]|nr:hypothetical protein HPB50_028178 [Hyalomma asiaticum]